MRSQGRMLLHLLLALLPTTMVLATSKQEYCDQCYNHTMCITPNIGPKCLQGRFVQGVNVEQQAVIIAEHNKVRNTVALGEERRGENGPQPKASNMKRLRWDDELATVAQRWANQCEYKHDECRTVPRYTVGQNLFIRSQWPCTGITNEPDWVEAITAWRDEVENFNVAHIPEFRSSPSTGHYTQLVWSDTESVGCGFTVFQDKDWCKKLYVCNYGPAGNIVGASIYEEGTPRSECPESQLDSNYPGLC